MALIYTSETLQSLNSQDKALDWWGAADLKIKRPGFVQQNSYQT